MCALFFFFFFFYLFKLLSATAIEEKQPASKKGPTMAVKNLVELMKPSTQKLVAMQKRDRTLGIYLTNELR